MRRVNGSARSACFISDARLETNGRVYWDPRQNFPEGHWSEARETFSKVILAARVRHRDGSAPIGPVLPPDLQVIEFPYYVGFLQALTRLPSLIVVARRCATAAEVCILRGPGMLSLLVWAWLALLKRPYAVEVLGDLQEVFTVNRSPIARLLRIVIPPIVHRVCRKAVAILYVSHALQAKYPAAPGTTAVVVSDVRMPDSLFRAPRKLHHDPIPLIMIHVGNMEQPYKGHETMIRSVALCKARGASVEMHFIGEGRMRPAFEKLASDLSVVDRVVFEGAVPWGPVLFERLESAHLFLFPSLTEAMGKALIEAMARGLPAIGTRVGGIPELLDSDLLVPPGSPELLADRILALANDYQSINEIADRCYASARRFADERLSPMRRDFYATVSGSVPSTSATGSGCANDG